MNGKKMTRALNRVAEPVKEESMWKGRAFAEVLRAALVIVMVAGLGVGSAAGKGKPPPEEPVTRFQVEYGTDPSSFNILPDGEGLFDGLPCFAQAPSGEDCPTLPLDPEQVIPAGCQYVDCYVDTGVRHKSGGYGSTDGFVILAENGEWRQVHQPNLALPDIYSDGRVYYRHFETDIEFQAILGNGGLGLCPELIDLDTDWTLGGSFDGVPADRVVRFTLWIDDWPAAEEVPISRVAVLIVIGAFTGFGQTDFVELETLFSGVPQSGAQFGSGVAVDGDLAVVASRFDGASGTGGNVYVYERAAGTVGPWELVGTLFPPEDPDPPINDRMGFSVAIDGTTIVVGARLVDNPSSIGVNHGAVYVFEGSPPPAGENWNWTLTDKLTPSDPNPGDFFGVSVAISFARVNLRLPSTTTAGKGTFRSVGTSDS